MPLRGASGGHPPIRAKASSFSFTYDSEREGLLSNGKPGRQAPQLDLKQRASLLVTAAVLIVLLVVWAAICSGGCQGADDGYDAGSDREASVVTVGAEWCSDWDVRLAGGSGAKGTPLVYKDGAYRPICSSSFADTDEGANIFCRQLGYRSGVAMRQWEEIPGTGGAYGQGALFVQACADGDGPTLASCESGDGAHPTGTLGLHNCRARLGGVALDIECSEPFSEGEHLAVRQSNLECTDTVEDEAYFASPEHAPDMPAAAHDDQGAAACKDWDVRLVGEADTSAGSPEVFIAGAFRPICGVLFADNSVGAAVLCRQLGYSDGTLSRLNTSYDQDAVFVKRCEAADAASLSRCASGSAEHGSGFVGAKACRAGQPVAVEVTCAGGSPSRKGKCVEPETGSAANRGHVAGAASAVAPDATSSQSSRQTSRLSTATATSKTTVSSTTTVTTKTGAPRTTTATKTRTSRTTRTTTTTTTTPSAASSERASAVQTEDNITAENATWPMPLVPLTALGHPSSGTTSKLTAFGYPGTTSGSVTTSAAIAMPPGLVGLQDVLQVLPGPGFEDLNLNRCALIGASSVMTGSGAGADIDSYDTVIRVNRIPTSEYWQDFGQKTDALFLNTLTAEHNDSVSLMRGGVEPVTIGCRHLDNCRSAAIIVRGDWGCPIDKLADAWGLDHSLVGCSHRNISNVAHRLQRLHGYEPSSGFQAFLAFLPLCRTLDLYGFGGTETADGHIEWERHALKAEHEIQDDMIAQHWENIQWAKVMPEEAGWIQVHAGSARKVVGTVP